MTRRRTGNPRVDIRTALDTSVGPRLLLPRGDVEALLALTATTRTTEVVTLTADMDEIVAEAAWTSAPTSRVASHGWWDDLPEDDPRRVETLAAARRFLHYLLTGEVLPEEPAPQPAQDGTAP